MTPDYIIIGAMKCGSSTLCAYLEDHPGAFMVQGEPRYFSHDEQYAKGPGWYEAQFAAARPGQPKGEGSNAYTHPAWFPHAATRMAAYNPALKLIYITRHPIERIVSAWVQRRVDMGDWIAPSIDEALRTQRDLFLDQSLYWKNLSQYRALFPDSQIHLAFMEDLKRDPRAVLRGVCQFLGIDADVAATRPHQNKSADKHVPSASWSRLKKLPGLRAVVQALLPAQTRLALRNRYFSRAPAEVATLSPRTRSWLAGVLREDSKAFLAHAGKPADFWSF